MFSRRTPLLVLLMTTAACTAPAGSPPGLATVHTRGDAIIRLDVEGHDSRWRDCDGCTCRWALREHAGSDGPALRPAAQRTFIHRARALPSTPIALVNRRTLEPSSFITNTSVSP
jgi:hypothetical protein